MATKKYKAPPKVEEKEIKPKAVPKVGLSPVVKEEPKIKQGNSQITDAMRKRAKEVFATHNATVKEVYFTSDGTAFTGHQFARIHSEFLKNDTIVTVKRSEV